MCLVFFSDIFLVIISFTKAVLFSRVSVCPCVSVHLLAKLLEKILMTFPANGPNERRLLDSDDRTLSVS